MDIMQAIEERHSVRKYEEKELPEDVVKSLQEEIEACNREGDLHIQLVTNEPEAFRSPMAHFGRFTGVTSYIALVGKTGEDTEELLGYYGERLVIRAQMLGLNSCWVALTFRKVPGAYEVGEGEKLAAVISLGYGKTQGRQHRSKNIHTVSSINDVSPDWFRKGVEAALLAPTAMNQQRFYFDLTGSGVRASAGVGIYAKLDLGIVKYHFEIGSGKDHSIWR